MGPGVVTLSAAEATTRLLTLIGPAWTVATPSAQDTQEAIDLPNPVLEANFCCTRSPGIPVGVITLAETEVAVADAGLAANVADTISAEIWSPASTAIASFIARSTGVATLLAKSLLNGRFFIVRTIFIETDASEGAVVVVVVVMDEVAFHFFHHGKVVVRPFHFSNPGKDAVVVVVSKQRDVASAATE